MCSDNSSTAMDILEGFFSLILNMDAAVVFVVIVMAQVARGQESSTSFDFANNNWGQPSLQKTNEMF